MALGALGCCSSILRCSSRSARPRPRPLSFLGTIALLSCWGCPCFFFQPSDGGAGGGNGGGSSAGSGDAEGAEAHPVLTKGANSEVGAERIHCNDNKNDDIEQIKLGLTTIQHYLASIDKHLKTIVDFHVLIDNRLTMMMGISGFASPLATRQGPSTAAVVTGTPANEEAVKRMKGLLGSMCSIADKLPMFCGSVLLWLLSNSGQNFDPWMQVVIPGSLVMCFISFILLAFTSKFKERESIDGVLFKISIWLLLPVFFAPWPGLCMILHIFAHTSKFILWPLGALFSVLSVSFWFLNFYKEQQKILEELKGGCVPENVVLPENPESEAASAQGLHRDNSYTV